MKQNYVRYSLISMLLTVQYKAIYSLKISRYVFHCYLHDIEVILIDVPAQEIAYSDRWLRHQDPYLGFKKNNF